MNLFKALSISIAFVVSDEWYEFNESPRPRVHVLAHADESTYRQNKPMGDHPMVWINENYRRMVYIAIGHDASLCVNRDFEVLVRDAILWAGSQKCDTSAACSSFRWQRG